MGAWTPELEHLFEINEVQYWDGQIANLKQMVSDFEIDPEGDVIGPRQGRMGNPTYYDEQLAYLEEQRDEAIQRGQYGPPAPTAFDDDPGLQDEAQKSSTEDDDPKTARDDRERKENQQDKDKQDKDKQDKDKQDKDKQDDDKQKDDDDKKPDHDTDPPSSDKGTPTPDQTDDYNTGLAHVFPGGRAPDAPTAPDPTEIPDSPKPIKLHGGGDPNDGPIDPWDRYDGLGRGPMPSDPHGIPDPWEKVGPLFRPTPASTVAFRPTTASNLTKIRTDLIGITLAGNPGG